MKKPELTYTRILLIVLGVIVAIIIGLNTSAVGMEETHHQWMEILPEHSQTLAFKAVNYIGHQIVSHFNALI